ncbi:Uncharacterised protein [Mycobacteroides abscessus subsp. massiliense]|nr:Uncharacterised protein [Mycobacteroides abscessus subsp. massiliense]
MELIAGMDAESPMSRNPAGRSSGTSKRAEPKATTGMVIPGWAAPAHRQAGPAGSWITTSIANSPASASVETMVYAR